MVIRREQLDSMARSSFFEKLRAFLRERVRREELLRFMDDRGAMFSLWLHIGQRFDLGSEYRAAVILSYAWFQLCSNRNPEQEVSGLLALGEAEYQAKCYFESSGILRFSEFDLALDSN